MISSTRMTRGDLGWLLVVAVVGVLLCVPFARTVGWLGDEGILLHGAERALHRHKLYRDTFSFLPPGGYVVTQMWFAIAGVSLASARVLAIASIAGAACFTFLACREASRHAPTSAVIAIAWVLTSQGVWTQVSYHWISALFAMIAAWMALRDESPRHGFLAGIAVGAAGMVMPTVGALAAVAALTAFIGSRRVLISYLIGCAVIPLILIADLAVEGTLIAAFNEAILFTAQHYAPIQGVPFGSGATAQNQPLWVLYPFLALATLALAVRDAKGLFRERRLRTCLAFAAAGFISCFPRPDITHIAFAATLACPLLALSVRQMAAPWSRAARYAAAGIAIGLLAPSAMAFVENAKAAQAVEETATPRGRVRFPGQPGLKEMVARIAATPATDRFLFYPYMPLLPVLTAREHVSAYDIFVPGYTVGSQYKEACIAAMRNAAWVMVDRGWTDPAFLKAIFPAMGDAAPPEVTAFEAALESGFEPAARDGTFELRKRSDAASETLCTAIPQ